MKMKKGYDDPKYTDPAKFIEEELYYCAVTYEVDECAVQGDKVVAILTSWKSYDDDNNCSKTIDGLLGDLGCFGLHPTADVIPGSEYGSYVKIKVVFDLDEANRQMEKSRFFSVAPHYFEDRDTDTIYEYKYKDDDIYDGKYEVWQPARKMKKYSGYTSYNDTEIEEIEEYRGFIISKVIDEDGEYYTAMDTDTGETYDDMELSSLKSQIDNIGKSKSQKGVNLNMCEDEMISKSAKKMRDSKQATREFHQSNGIGKSIPTWNKIEKRCPNGYHKDPKSGQCVDANGNYYQGKQEQPKQEQKPKREKKPEKYVNYKMGTLNEQRMKTSLNDAFDTMYYFIERDSEKGKKTPKKYEDGWCDYHYIESFLSHVKNKDKRDFMRRAEKEGLIEVKYYKDEPWKPRLVRPTNWRSYKDESSDKSAKKSKGQNHSASLKKSIAKRYMGDESDPDWDAGAGRWKVGGDTHVKIYQISGKNLRGMPEDDPVYQYYLKHKFREDKEDLDLSYYDQTWEGDMNVHGKLEDLYGMMQEYRPIETSRTIYSLSVGDLVEMDGKLYMVDDFGFSEVTNIKRSAKKMKKSIRKDMDVEGVFDDYHQESQGSYCLHLKLNGDSFYPKYFYNEEDFNREVQRAIDNGYEESSHSNYTDNDGMFHRHFWKDNWGKSTRKMAKTVNRKEDVRCQNCGSDNVELRQIAEFRSGSVPGSPLRSEHFRIICNDCGATTYDDVQYDNVDKSYVPEYKDFKSMVKNLKVTKDNRTVFKE